MEIYQLKVTLNHIKPPIWRRVEVPVDVKLGKLHRILQAAMGWTDIHLHAFRIGNECYGVPDPDFPSDTKNERNIRLDSVAQQGDRFFYDYDFGDGWEHEIKVEKILPAETAVHYPRCVDGKRACPPEDCGGPPGYEYLLEALADPEHEEHDSMIEWIGGEFDPEVFDVEKVNQALWRMR